MWWTRRELTAPPSTTTTSTTKTTSASASGIATLPMPMPGPSPHKKSKKKKKKKKAAVTTTTTKTNTKTTTAMMMIHSAKESNQTGAVYNTNTKQRAQALVSFASGCLSGVLSAILLQPTDVLRTKMQGDALRLGSTATVFSSAKATIAESGFRGLWKGTQPAVIRVGLGIGMHMMIIEILRKRFGESQADGNVKLSALGALGTGAAARTIATIFVSPITVVKTRMEYFGTRVNTLNAVVQLGKTEGVSGLFRGIVPNIASSVPFSALYYTLYTNLQEKMNQSNQPRIVKNVAASSCAAVVATLITQPADILRTQAQLDLANANAFSVLLKRCRQLGFQTLFIGSTPRFAKRTMQAVLVWTVYEELFRMCATKLKVS